MHSRMIEDRTLTVRNKSSSGGVGYWLSFPARWPYTPPAGVCARTFPAPGISGSPAALAHEHRCPLHQWRLDAAAAEPSVNRAAPSRARSLAGQKPGLLPQHPPDPHSPPVWLDAVRRGLLPNWSVSHDTRRTSACLWEFRPPRRPGHGKAAPNALILEPQESGAWKMETDRCC
jgi:hypothetical protein